MKRIIISILIFALGSCGNKPTIEPEQLRDYQIELKIFDPAIETNKDSLYIYSGNRFVGAIPFTHSAIDSLLLKDNE